MGEFLSFLGIIAIVAGVIYFFGWIQEKSGVTLVQNNIQRRNLVNADRLSSNMLHLADANLVEKAKQNCIKKGQRLTSGNILIEVSILENEQRIIRKSQGEKRFDLDFPEILKEGEIRAGSSWLKTPSQTELSAAISMIKYERYTKEAFNINSKLSSEIIGGIFKEIASSRNLINAQGLLIKDLNRKEHREIKELLLRKINELE